MNSATAVLNLLSAHETEQEFKDGIERNRLLFLCKTKGFSRLAGLGLIEQAEVKPTEEERFARQEDMAEEAAKIIETGATIAHAAYQLGVNKSTMQYWLKKRKRGDPRHQNLKYDYTEMTKNAIRLSRGGHIMKHIAIKLKVRPETIYKALGANGYRYERISKQIVKTC